MAAAAGLLLVGGGYLGTRLARLLADDSRVRALGVCVRTEDSARRLVRDGIEAVVADITEPDSVRRLAASRDAPEWIIQCVSTPRGGGEDAYRAVYREGAANLRAAFPESRLLFVSSTSVYGRTDGGPVTEESPAEPARRTGRILLEAEDIALGSGGGVARLAGLYGPGRSVLLRKFLDGTAVIEDGGGRVINQIHRDDAASAIVRLVTPQAPCHGVFNVADDTPITQIDLYARLAERLGRPMPPPGPRDPRRKRGWTSKRVLNAKLRAIGWIPRFPSFFDALDTGRPGMPDIRAA